MSYVCETLQLIDGVQTCVSWVQYVEPQIIPDISVEDRDALILFALKCFVLVFGFRQVLKMFGHRY